MAEEKGAKKSLFGFNFGMAWEHFWRPALQVAVVGAMLVIGIFIGKELTAVPGASQQEPMLSESDADTIVPYDKEINAKKQEYFLTAAENSFDRSSRLLNDFMELEPDQVVQNRNVIVDRRDEMLNLMEELSMIRDNVNDPRFSIYSPLLDEIELTIGEIAGIGGDPSDIRFEIRALQDGIRKRELLGRLKSINISITVNTK